MALMTANELSKNSQLIYIAKLVMRYENQKDYAS